MDPKEQFDELVRRRLAPVLKAHGFRRAGLTFHLFEYGNWGVINVQKHGSTPEAVRFTVNVGTASTRLAPTHPVDWRSRRPNVYECDWRQRLGHFITGADQWWTIDATTDIHVLAAELIDPIERLAIPEIHHLISDEALRDYWLSGQYGGLTGTERIHRLRVLLRVLGPAERLAEFGEEAEQAERERARRDQQELAAIFRRLGFTQAEGNSNEWLVPTDLSDAQLQPDSEAPPEGESDQQT